MQKSSWPLGKGSNTSNLINKLAPCTSHRPVLIPVILTINTERRETLFHLGTHSGPFNAEIVQFQCPYHLTSLIFRSQPRNGK